MSQTSLPAQSSPPPAPQATRSSPGCSTSPTPAAGVSAHSHWSGPNSPTAISVDPMNKTTSFDLAQAAPVATPADAAHPQSLLDLPHGEARQSLLTVHSILEAKLPQRRLAIYEAGG